MTLALDTQYMALDNMRLPGIIESINISGKLVLDKKNTEKQSGATTSVNGWDNATIDISIILPNDNTPTAEQKLTRLIDAFHAVNPDDHAPPLYTLSGPLATAWRINQVRFLELRSAKDKNSDTIKATLKLIEENTTQRLIEERAPAAEATQPEDLSKPPEPKTAPQAQPTTADKKAIAQAETKIPKEENAKRYHDFRNRNK